MRLVGPSTTTTTTTTTHCLFHHRTEQRVCGDRKSFSLCIELRCRLIGLTKTNRRFCSQCPSFQCFFYSSKNKFITKARFHSSQNKKLRERERKKKRLIFSLLASFDRWLIFDKILKLNLLDCRNELAHILSLLLCVASALLLSLSHLLFVTFALSSARALTLF